MSLGLFVIIAIVSFFLTIAILSISAAPVEQKKSFNLATLQGFVLVFVFLVFLVYSWVLVFRFVRFILSL